MPKKSSNANLHTANRAKKDEFYTQLEDIEKELKHYKDQFNGKTVYCNCDDPYESNFFKYFAANFNALGLKKLIATSFAKSPVVGQQILPFEIKGLESEKQAAPKKKSFKMEITEMSDVTGDGRVDLEDVEWKIRNDKSIATPLAGDGDFRSPECVALLKEADIVVTNPPFSLFREYVAQLVAHKKKFLIIGNVNAVTLYLNCIHTRRVLYFAP